MTAHLGPIVAAAARVDATGVTNNGRLYEDPTLGPCYTGTGGCLASVRVGFVQASAAFTRSQCANGAALAASHGLTIAIAPGDSEAILVTIPRSPTLAEALGAVEALRAAGANVIVGCFYLSTSQMFFRALEVADFTPLALTISASHVSSYKAAIDGGWWQGEYAMGPTPWHHTSPVIGAVSGMTSTEFFEEYRSRYGNAEVSYHGAANFGAAVALVHAIETAGNISAPAVRDVLQTMNVSEFYGHIKFDTNNQYAGGMLVVQYGPGNTSEDIVYPPALAGTAHPYFPWAPWHQRRCAVHGPGTRANDTSLPRADAECSGHGQCNAAGTCICTDAHYSGVSCADKLQVCDPRSIQRL